MKLLAIDTSSETCSAALLIDGRIEQRLEYAPRRHGELILPMMQDLLEQAGLAVTDLDAMAFGCGPGSFTGVRIATAVIQGAAFGAEVPVVPVSTLAAMAQGHHRRTGEKRLLVALDARMDEVYWGCFEIDTNGLAESCCDERVCPPETVSAPPGVDWFGVGPGWSAYRAALTERLGAVVVGTDAEAICEARDIAILAEAAYAAGWQIPADQAMPVYLRDRVTRTA